MPLTCPLPSGEVTLQIEPNRELCGKILAYGQYLEVMQPQSLRVKIGKIAAQISSVYSVDKPETEAKETK